MNKEEFLDELEKLTHEQQEEVLAYLHILDGETPTNPLAVLRLNRKVIKAQMNGKMSPDATTPMLAGMALNIIDGVTNLADRRVLMSYYWHAEDVHSKKIPDVLKRNGFTPA